MGYVCAASAQEVGDILMCIADPGCVIVSCKLYIVLKCSAESNTQSIDRSRNPFFSFFRTVLTQAYGLSLLRPGGERVFIEQVYRHPIPQPGGSVRIPCIEGNKMYRPLQFVTPLHKGLFYRETPIVPLAKALGPEQFLLILSAILCERRIIFVAEDVGTLSGAVNAAAAMLYPFRWPHMFIPLLPSKLLSYAAAPTPYMIGVRRYLLPLLHKEVIDDVVIVDLDSGECTMHGNCQIKNFVGAAGTVRKQATESLSRMTAGMSKLLSSTKTTGPATGDDRDLVACLLADLKSGMSKMPRNNGDISDMFRMGKSATDGSIERFVCILVSFLYYSSFTALHYQVGFRV